MRKKPKRYRYNTAIPSIGPGTAYAPAIFCAVILGLLLSGCITTGWLSNPAEPRVPLKKVGEVTAERTFWNVLFLKSPEERRDILLEDARREAVRVYGPRATVASPQFDSRWSALSLLLGLDMVGFVERSEVTVDVLLPAGGDGQSDTPVPSMTMSKAPPLLSSPEELPLPDVEPEYQTVISYSIIPQEKYVDRYGYIRLEYRTPDEAKELITARLDKQKAEKHEYEEQYAAIPKGGYIVVHIGRQELMHANTKWYSYRICSEGKPILAREGEEGIPNVRGRDGNWWNEVPLPLRQPIASSIDVMVTDNRTGTVYDFMVNKLIEMKSQGIDPVVSSFSEANGTTRQP